MAFVGPDLLHVVDYLEECGASYLVLHQTPSVLTLKHSLIPIMFPECKDPLLHRDDTDTNCLYTPKRLAKVVWGPVRDEAPAFYRFIQNFGLSYEEYCQLLQTYNYKVKSESLTNFDEIVCEWLKQNTSISSEENPKTIYQHKIDNLPFQGKSELYIGGIFPITGKKYRAPDLAQGK